MNKNTSYRVWIKKNVFPSTGIASIAFTASLTTSYLIYTSFLQRHFFSWRYLATISALFFFLMFFFGWITAQSFAPLYSLLNIKERMVFFLGTLALGSILLFNIPLQPIYYLLPDSELSISFDTQDVGSTSEKVKLLWIDTGQGFIHHTQMEMIGTWEKQESALVFENGQSVRILWIGKAGAETDLAFQSTSFDQEVQIGWNGKITNVNLYQQFPSTITFKTTTALPVIFKVLYASAFLISFPFFVFFLFSLLNKWKPTSHPTSTNNWSWVPYMACMLVVWLFSLFIFWPGVMSNDSLDLWNQAVTGDFNDWQSALYSALLFILLRLIPLPGFVLILQIVSFSFLVAFGLHRFEKRGVPKLALWLICIVFALSPLNNMQAITLWKDIPYAVAFLWLTVLFFEIYDSEGNWILKWKNTSVFLLFSFGISILRLNGIPVVLASILVLTIVYKNQRKRFLVIMGCLLAFFFFTKNPFYDLIGVNREISGGSNQILLHRIAAHLNAGTSFEENERAYLDNLLPLEEWDYQCCYMGPIYLHQNFKKTEFLLNGATNRKLAFQLFLRDPVVDIQHSFCAGEPAWRFGQTACPIYSTHGFNRWEENNQDWIVPNRFSLKELSLFPGLVQKYADALRDFGFLDDNLIFYLRPAFSFYVFCLSLLIAYLINKDWKIFLIGLPIILQTCLLFLINFAPVLRYFYATNLIGLLFIGILFYRKQN